MGEIDLDQSPPAEPGGDTARWTIDRLRRPWPRPAIVAVTIVLTLLAAALVWRPAAPEAATTATITAGSSWEELYGRAVRKLAGSGAAFDVVNAVDSGVPTVSTLDAGEYRMEFACASDSAGIDLAVLVDAGDGAGVRSAADCDSDHTFTVFTLPEGARVTIWVGSYQVAQTAYAFAVRSG
ncbi:hypothetical protein [Actinorhabdospora filicis]|nr:hypothetical protein [Actinorhabdospora filicis]